MPCQANAGKEPPIGKGKGVMKRSNLILIGMPGSGKSTVGRTVADRLQLDFVDSDDLIEQKQGLRLQDIIDRFSSRQFRGIEEKVLLDVDLQGHVIATGGSAVYSDRAMAHLKTIGWRVFLDVSLMVVQKRLSNFSTRGIVRQPGQNLADLFHQRRPLYLQHADYQIAADLLSLEQTCDQVAQIAKERCLQPTDKNE